MFQLKPKPAELTDTEALDNLYREYERRILWKLNDAEDAKHERVCRDYVGKHEMETKPMKPGIKWCKCRTRQNEIHEWEDWAVENFGKEAKDISWTVPRDLFSKVSA